MGRSRTRRRILLVCFCVIAVPLVVGVPFGLGSRLMQLIWPPVRLELATLRASGEQLRHTRIVAVLDAPLRQDENLIWCGSFQLAWNELCEFSETAIRTIPESELVARLNRRAFTRDQLDSASWMAIAGFVGDGIFDSIRGEIKARFPGDAAPGRLPEEPSYLRPQDIVAYSYIFKDLRFAAPFQRLTPLSFKGSEVPAFGVNGDCDGGRYSGQVTILYYADPADFAVELATTPPGDRLILARVAPRSTLALTVSDVESRMQIAPATAPAASADGGSDAPGAGPRPLLKGDVLKIPKFDFDLHRDYRELEGLDVIQISPKIPPNAVIFRATQGIRFLLDEEGVRLKSDAYLEVTCSARPPRARLVFDGPFLLMMKRADARTPYFVMWVAHPEIWGQ